MLVVQFGHIPLYPRFWHVHMGGHVEPFIDQKGQHPANWHDGHGDPARLRHSKQGKNTPQQPSVHQ